MNERGASGRDMFRRKNFKYPQRAYSLEILLLRGKVPQSKPSLPSWGARRPPDPPTNDQTGMLHPLRMF